MINRELKELVDNMCDAIDTFATKVGLSDGTGEAARMELGMFMMYLSASDGQISWDEAKTISDICKLNLSPNDLGRFIREKNIYSTEFEKKVPATFQLMVAADNILFDAGQFAYGSRGMLGAYKAIGEALIKSDNNVDDNEVSDYRIYINMLEEYRDNNYKGAKREVTGFTKNGGSVSAPAKGGVVAPKKG